MLNINKELIQKELNKLKQKDNKEYQQIERLIYALSLRGRDLNRPQAASLRDDIYELRPKKHRVLYTFLGDDVVLLSICKKSGSKVSAKDFELALKRKKNILF